ncbi:hypothetical protein CPB86DRAFT_870690 [Serendipita vermifera]|nr:hypothetical protein CPB86DRAFT_870690 [Serendipita vermifera]
MTVSTNRYSALLQESTGHESTPTQVMLSASKASSSPAVASVVNQNQSFLVNSTKYPPGSSVFVASLPHVAPLQDLQEKLLKLISESIDPVSVKIINDKFGHKAAFVQAKSQEDADVLLKATLRLEGRLLRLERARAHRALALSFTRPSGIVSKLRIIRGTDRQLRAIVNETVPPESLIPQVPEDPFSGSGYLIKQFRHSGDGINGLCRLLGALESFRQMEIEASSTRSEKQAREAHHPHVLLPAGSLSQPGIWEAKWETRDDATQARYFFATIPFICCTWAHTTFHEATAPKYASETANGVFQNKGGRLNSQDFPSLAEAETLGHLPKHESKHARSLSDETNIPITPVSLRDLSPEVVSPDENTLIPSHEISARLSILKNAPPVTQEYTSQFNNVQFDLTTLYVTGLPKARSDAALKHLFQPFGRVRSIINLTSKKEFGAAFVSFGNLEAPAKAIKSFRDGQQFTLDGHTLHIKYKKFKPFVSRKNQNSLPDTNMKVEDGIQPSPSEHPNGHLETKNSPKNHMETFVNEATLSTEYQANSQGETEMVHPGTDDGHLSMNPTHDTSEKQSDAQTANPTNLIVTGVEVPVINPSTSSVSPAPGADANSKTPAYYYPHPTTAWPHPYAQYGSYPYAAYHPMYATQPYPQSYWYPSGIVPIAVSTTASQSGQHTSTTNNYPMPMQAPASFLLGNQDPHTVPRGPVMPIGCYRHPNGSITYVYPSDVVEKYKSEQKDGQNGVSSHVPKDVYAAQAAFRMPHPAMMPMYPGMYPSTISQDTNKPFASYTPVAPYPVSHSVPGLKSPGTANYANTSGQAGGMHNLASNAAVASNGALDSLGMSGVRHTGFGGTSPQAQQLLIPAAAVNSYAGQAGYVPGPQYAPFHYNGDTAQHPYNGYGMIPGNGAAPIGSELGSSHQA